MVLWILFAVMTAAAVTAVLWPIGRKPTHLHGGNDKLVYQDQLAEIDRDHIAGLIGDGAYVGCGSVMIARNASGERWA